MPFHLLAVNGNGENGDGELTGSAFDPSQTGFIPDPGFVPGVTQITVIPSPIEPELIPVAVDGEFGQNGEPAGGVTEPIDDPAGGGFVQLEGPFGLWTNSQTGQEVPGFANIPPDRQIGWVWSPVESDLTLKLEQLLEDLETMAEKDAVSDGTQLPNALPAGVGEGGTGQGGSVSVSVEGTPQQAPVRQAGLAAGAVGLGLVAVVGVVVFAARRGKR